MASMQLAVETPWASSSIVATTPMVSYCENRFNAVFCLDPYLTEHPKQQRYTCDQNI
jgi:hypothetical protein